MTTAMKTMTMTRTSTPIWWRGRTRTTKLPRMSYRLLTRRMKQIKRKSHSGGSPKRKKGAKKVVAAAVAKNRRPKTKRKTTNVWTTRPQRRPVILHKAAILRLSRLVMTHHRFKIVTTLSDTGGRHLRIARDNKRAAATKLNPAVRKKIAKIN